MIIMIILIMIISGGSRDAVSFRALQFKHAPLREPSASVAGTTTAGVNIQPLARVHAKDIHTLKQVLEFGQDPRVLPIRLARTCTTRVSIPCAVPLQ